MPLVENSALTTQISSTISHGTGSDISVQSFHHALALQVQHNLQHQHDWTDCVVQTHPPPQEPGTTPVKPFPRPLVLGTPPYRLYIHPDEQIQHIKAGINEKDLPSEAIWVLPTRKVETGWSLRRIAEIFDAIPEVVVKDGNNEKTVKRLLLATVDDDSTVVYYILHDGIVKPRQN